MVQKSDPHALLRKLIADHPGASEEDIRRLFWEACLHDPDMQRVIVGEVFSDLHHEITGEPRLN
jgi:hypothetical protein